MNKDEKMKENGNVRDIFKSIFIFLSCVLLYFISYSSLGTIQTNCRATSGNPLIILSQPDYNFSSPPIVKENNTFVYDTGANITTLLIIFLFSTCYLFLGLKLITKDFVLTRALIFMGLTAVFFVLTIGKITSYMEIACIHSMKQSFINSNLTFIHSCKCFPIIPPIEYEKLTEPTKIKCVCEKEIEIVEINLPITVYK